MARQPSETNPEGEVDAAIVAFARSAALCTQSPPAPDGAGWGVPDWHDEKAYPTAHELDDLEWRWEFLRRNHGYRQDWLRAAWEFSPCPRERYFQGAYGVCGPFDPRHSIRAMPGYPSSIESKKKPAVSYRSSGRAPFLEVLLSNRFANIKDIERIIRRPAFSSDVYVRYDLSRPINPQAKEIKDLLIRLRREQFGENVDRVRQRRPHWPLYLRLLDAADSGTSYRDTIPTIATQYRSSRWVAASKGPATSWLRQSSFVTIGATERRANRSKFAIFTGEAWHVASPHEQRWPGSL